MRFCRSPGIEVKILPSAPIRNSGTSKMATAPLSSSSLAAGLLQGLSADSSLSSIFSSQSFETALQSASPADLVTLSAQALQLQQADLLFTDSNPVSSSTSASDSLTAILSAIESSDTASTASAAPSSAASLANEASAYQGALQSEDIQALFGIGQPKSPASVLNAIA